jgi:hypothetical protein
MLTRQGSADKSSNLDPDPGTSCKRKQATWSPQIEISGGQVKTSTTWPGAVLPGDRTISVTQNSFRYGVIATKRYGNNGVCGSFPAELSFYVYVKRN